MATDWQLLRNVLNSTIDACEAIEKLAPNLEAGEYAARSSFQDDVSVGDFLERFWRYPEGAGRDILRVRSALGADQKYRPEIARALINTAIACAEAIGLPEEQLAQEAPNLTPHCGSGGKSVRSLLEGIGKIQKGWMLKGITKALAEHRK